MLTLKLLFGFYFMSVAMITGYLLGKFVHFATNNINLGISVGVVSTLFLGVPLIASVI